MQVKDKGTGHILFQGFQPKKVYPSDTYLVDIGGESDP